MFVNEPTIRVRAALLAALTVCSACGGGGGGVGGGTVVGGGGSPPTTPLPVVTARIVASATSVQEGQPFKLDASTSSEAGGATLTYAWVQTSGPAVTITTPTSAALNLIATEVSADTAAQFRLTATSGVVSASATVDVTFTNIAQTPVFLNLEEATDSRINSTFGGLVATIVGNWSFGLVGTSDTLGGSISFTQFDVNGPATIVASPTQPFGQTFTQPATFDMTQALVTGGGGVGSIDFTRPSILVTEETANRYRVFRKTPGGSFGPPLQDISITRPCATQYRYFGPPNALTTNTYVGQRERGFTILSETGAVAQEINTGQSFCALALPQAAVDDSVGRFSYPSTPEDLIAIDTVANTVNHFGPSVSNPALYELKSQAAVRLNSATPLRFVAATTIRAKDEYGSYFPVAGLALVYTDGNHAGQHRLVTVGLDDSRKIRQTTRSWPLGVPSDVILDDLDMDKLPELIVISSTSPQAIVYEMRDLTWNSTFMMIPDELDPTPRFMEIGLGATKALSTMYNILSLEGLFVAYRDKKQVKLFYPAE